MAAAVADFVLHLHFILGLLISNCFFFPNGCSTPVIELHLFDIDFFLVVVLLILS